MREREARGILSSTTFATLRSRGRECRNDDENECNIVVG